MQCVGQRRRKGAVQHQLVRRDAQLLCAIGGEPRRRAGPAHFPRTCFAKKSASISAFTLFSCSGGRAGKNRARAAAAGLVYVGALCLWPAPPAFVARRRALAHRALWRLLTSAATRCLVSRTVWLSSLHRSTFGSVRSIPDGPTRAFFPTSEACCSPSSCDSVDLDASPKRTPSTSRCTRSST